MDPKLTLYASRGCDFCKDAEDVLREAGLSYVRLWVARLCPGTITIWSDDNEHIATEPESTIPGLPALCVRESTPAPIFIGPEQVVLFAAGELVRRGESERASELLSERFPAFAAGSEKSARGSQQLSGST